MTKKKLISGEEIVIDELEQSAKSYVPSVVWWTPKEEKILRKYGPFGTTPADPKVLMKYFPGRTWNSIYDKAKRMRRNGER